MSEYLYVGPRLDGVAVFSTDVLADTTERHKVSLDVGTLTATTDVVAELGRHPGIEGVVIAMAGGLTDRARARIARAALDRRLRVWLHWPWEGAVECVDTERLKSNVRLRNAVVLMERVGPPLAQAGERWHRVRPGLRWIYRGRFTYYPADPLARMERWSLDARPVPLPASVPLPTASSKIGSGLYLRFDFWVRIVSGGSYGHTCYVAKELAALCDRFVCLFAQRYDLLDRLGVQQVVLDSPTYENETSMATASDAYLPIVRAACRLTRPDFMYERLCLGNYVGALLSRELQIPYLVEYNGSELTMQRSENNSRPVYADLFLKGEEIAFRQATAISVVSEHVKTDLVSRGVDAAKILVNPNGADLDSYSPGTPDQKRDIRRTLGFDDDDCVIGFTGTFGWWHGIDVLAAAVPRICADVPAAKFLIIGDGTYKAQLDAEIERHGLDSRVRRVGMVPQEEGARLLKACDIYVSPHNSHMVDGKFFGSPTKIFEYMAMEGGIVASDLEQIGEVLSPALRPADLERPGVVVTNERSVLCTPGDIDEFVAGVVGLARRPDLCKALGRNARQAVVDHYSWQQHVARLWTFTAGLPRDSGAREVETSDEYKGQVQNQWNNNPVGSETARGAQPHTLEWFQEVERYRYDVYAPWMRSVMEFAGQAGKQLLEIGGGMGTDLVQFAKHGALVTDVDLSGTHLALAQENFRLRGLVGRFVHHDAESLPFENNSFDVVYSNGVLHHTPHTARAVKEILRVLKPGGRAIVMVYAEHSLQYWRNIVWSCGMKTGDISRRSIADIMSQTVERTGNEARPLVKVYTRAGLRALFRDFGDVEIAQRQISPELVPRPLHRFLSTIERLAGWNLIIKAQKA